MLGGVGGTNDELLEVTDEEQELKTAPTHDAKVLEKLDQYERLKAEFEQVANDLIAERRARSSFQQENSELLQKQEEYETRVGKLNEEC